MDDQTLRLVKDRKGNNEMDKIKSATEQDYILQADTSKENPQQINSYMLFDVGELKSALDDLSDVKYQVKQGSNYHFVALNIDDLAAKTDALIRAKGCTKSTSLCDSLGNVIMSYDIEYPPTAALSNETCKSQFLAEAQAKRFK